MRPALPPPPADGFGLVLTLGGDGTVNEAVNGILGAPARPGRAEADGRPALAALPGGNANVFTRTLGLPPDPVDAAGRILDALTAGVTAPSAWAWPATGTSPSTPASA